MRDGSEVELRSSPDAVVLKALNDILVLAPTRWKLRAAVRLVNEVLSSLDLEQHPDKTFIGRIDKGFDFLGYHFAPGHLSVARPTVDRFIEQATRLYEQEPRERLGASALGGYVRRWGIWAQAGVTLTRPVWLDVARPPVLPPPIARAGCALGLTIAPA